MSRFAEMRKKSANSADVLAAQLSAGEKYEADERYWTLTKDAAGNGSAVIRFLPAPAGEEDNAPYVKLWSHGFKGPTGQWYIEKSLTTIGKQDPVSEHNQKLWATETKENQATVRQRKRGLRYVSNVYVIKDGANPANEGKVFLFSYGQKIMDKIVAAVSPEFEDQAKIDPFDLWAGANFRLRVKMVDGGNNKKFPNYDSSEFAPQAALLDDDEAMEQIWNQEYSLKAEVAPDQFKTYAELKERFYAVICEDAEGTPAGTGRAAQKRDEVVDDSDDDRTAATTTERKTTASFAKTAAAPAADEEDSDLEWFKSIENDLN